MLIILYADCFFICDGICSEAEVRIYGESGGRGNTEDSLYTVHLVCIFSGGKLISRQPEKMVSLGLLCLNMSQREIDEKNLSCLRTLEKTTLSPSLYSISACPSISFPPSLGHLTPCWIFLMNPLFTLK